EVGPILLQVLAELHGLRERDPLVDVVQQLDLVAHLAADVLEQLRDQPYVRRRLPDARRVGGAVLARPARGARRPARAVGGHTLDRDLDADVTEAALDGPARLVLHLGEVAPARVVVAVGALAHLPAEELVER